jgi:hypothetical protein
MADFSLTTLFVVPIGQTTLPSLGSTQDLTAGQLGLALNDYTLATNVAAAPYFYIAQGRTNTYLQGSKRSDKIKGCPSANCKSNVTEWYKVTGCPTPRVQITDINDWHVKCGEVVTLTIRAHSSYIDTLYFNGLTRSVTVQAPCCDCNGDPCDDVDVDTLIDSLIAGLELHAPGINPDNLILSNFFTFTRIGSGVAAILRITGKALTVYAQPCDVAAFPHEYDKMRFNTFVYSGPATTADFIVSDACNIVADSTIIQTSTYATGTSAEIAQLEKNYYSYQAGYLKHLFRMAGWNGNFESWVSDGATYTTYYIKFNEIDKSAYNWGDYIEQDSMVIIAVPIVVGDVFVDALEAALETGLGSVLDDNVCVTTTSTTAAPTTTTTTAAPTTTTTTTAAQ